MNRLTVRGIDGTHQDYALDKGSLVIGRNPESGIHLKDSQVSWKHALLVCAQGGCVLEDLGSTNGTFIDEKRIKRHILRPGDKVKIGPFELTLRTLHAPSPNSASEHTLFAAADKYVQRSASRRSDDAVAVGVAAKRLVGKPAFGANAPAARRWRAAFDRMPLIKDWSASYRKADLRHELTAGITVAAMIVPQGMAYALLAGLPPVMGLYASILPMIVYALTGAGRQTSVGPVTVDSLMLVLGLSTLAIAGTASYIALAVVLTAVIGAIQLAMGALRLGFLVNFLSYPVLAGFTSAAAVITVMGQLKHLLGISQPQYPALYQTVVDVLQHATQANLMTLAIGVGCIVVLWGLKRWAPAAPGPLTLVVVCTALAYVWGLDAQGVRVLGEVPVGLPHLSLPTVHWADVRQLLPLALTMALVGFAQTISVGKSLGNKYGYDVDANRELTALGLSNVTSSVSQGYAVSGSLARSALNAATGARTPLAAIISALCVGLTTLYFTPLFHYLPNATLAAILVVAALRLIDTREIRFYIAGIKAPVREVMKRSGLYSILGGDHFFFTIDAAVKRFQEKCGAA